MIRGGANYRVLREIPAVSRKAGHELKKTLEEATSLQTIINNHK